MTRIKLTKGDFIFYDDYPRKDSVLGIACSPEYSLPELKQQILENQEKGEMYVHLKKN